MMYFGAGGSTPVDKLTAQGFPAPPPGYSVPDHLLDLASDSEVRSTSAIASHDGISEAGHRFGPSSANDSARQPDDEKVDVETNARSKGITHAGKAKNAAFSATFLTQFEVLSGREWKNLLRCALSKSI